MIAGEQKETDDCYHAGHDVVLLYIFITNKAWLGDKILLTEIAYNPH